MESETRSFLTIRIVKKEETRIEVNLKSIKTNKVAKTIAISKKTSKKTEMNFNNLITYFEIYVT